MTANTSMATAMAKDSVVVCSATGNQPLPRYPCRLGGSSQTTSNRIARAASSSGGKNFQKPGAWAGSVGIGVKDWGMAASPLDEGGRACGLHGGVNLAG